MRRRSRLRRFATWTGACATALVLTLWLGSCFWKAWYLWRGSTWGWQADCDWGTLSVDVCRRGRQAWPWNMQPGLYIFSHALRREVFAQHGLPPLDSAADRNYYGFVLPKLMTRPPPKLQAELGTVFWVRLPLWLPMLILAVPTGILFWRDRRYPPGHCQRCGYDLTGNVSGRCPECGGPVPDRGPQDAPHA